MAARQPQQIPQMMEKSRFRDTFFSLKNVAPQRPDSVHTEFMETDWDEDDILSEFEDGDSSPRLSMDSVRNNSHECKLGAVEKTQCG